MKFINYLLGKTHTTKPTWNIMPQADRPVPKPRNPDKPEAENKPIASDKEKQQDDSSPFLNENFLDTIALEEEAIPDDNPYSTHTWEQSPENDTRKMRTIQIGEKTEKKQGSEFNPYDTGKMRRGWKK